MNYWLLQKSKLSIVRSNKAFCRLPLQVARFPWGGR